MQINMSRFTTIEAYNGHVCGSVLCNLIFIQALIDMADFWFNLTMMHIMNYTVNQIVKRWFDSSFARTCTYYV